MTSPLKLLTEIGFQPLNHFITQNAVSDIHCPYYITIILTGIMQCRFLAKADQNH